jgi:hypothetical protein
MKNLAIVLLIIMSGCSNPDQSDKQVNNSDVKLITLDPGHFPRGTCSKNHVPGS